MRRKIETEERDNTTRASFVCTQCKKTYTDLEADQLCDLTTGEFRCNFCGDIVEESSNQPKMVDSRLVLAKFNQQIAPLYLLLKEVEDLQLPAELLEPEPIDAVLPGVKSEQDDPNRQWNSVDRNRSINSAYENMLLKENSMTVKIEETNNSILDSKKKDLLISQTDQPKKERPAWLTESTIFDENKEISNLTNGNLTNGNLTNGTTIKIIENEDKSSLNSYFQTNGILDTDQIKDSLAKEILEALMIYERPDENSNSKVNGHHLTNGNAINHFGNDFVSSNKLNGHASGNFNHLNGHYNHNSIDDDNDHYEPFKFPMCHVNGKLVQINKVDEDMIKVMNQQERDEFVKLSSEIYNLLYD